MMNRLFAILVLLALSTGAMAQWQVPLNTVPLGRGPGVSGFNNAGTLPTCADAVGQHLNWTGSVFACGTSVPANVVTTSILPTCADAIGQHLNWTGSVFACGTSVPANVVTTAILPTCADTIGQHLNWTGSAFACGTSIPANALTTANFATNFPGVEANVLNTQTAASYTVQTTDCGKRVQAGTGATGMNTVALPAVSGFAATCVVDVYNGDTATGKILSGFPTRYSSILYPLQNIQVAIVNGAWAITRDPGKWHPSTATVFVNPAGSDSNDCLATGTTRACLSINTAIKRWATDIDCSSGGVNITLDNGTHANDLGGVQVFYASNCGGPQGEVHITGSGHAAVIVQCSGGNHCFDVQEPATVQITGLTITTLGNSSVGIYVRQNATADYSDVSFSSFPLGTGIYTTTNAHSNITGNIFITGSMPVFLQCDMLSYCSFQGFTATVSGSLTFTNFVVAINGSVLDSSGTMTFAGAGAGAGSVATQCASQSNGIIRKGSTTYPGTAATCGAAQTATQGQIF